MTADEIAWLMIFEGLAPDAVATDAAGVVILGTEATVTLAHPVDVPGEPPLPESYTFPASLIGRFKPEIEDWIADERQRRDEIAASDRLVRQFLA